MANTKKKIGDFLLAVTLGLMPGELWDGRYSVNGGIIIRIESPSLIGLKPRLEAWIAATIDLMSLRS